MIVRRPFQGGLLCPSAERGVEDGLLVDPKRLLDNVLGVQLYTQKGCILKQVAARVAVALANWLTSC